MKCNGCGIEIQTKDKNKPGYLPENILQEKLLTGEKITCQRCFKLKHYNQLLPITVKSDFYPQLDKVLKDFKNILWVIDVMDFEGTFREDISKKLKNKNLILLVNKIDLLPKTLPLAELKKWIFARVKDKVNIKIENIRMVSAKKKFGMNRVFRILNEKNIKKALIMGVTNVGKSSLINSFSHNDITISSYPGTTLKMIKTKIKKYDIELYDTPGIEPKDRICDMFDIFTQVKIIPKREISRKTFKVDPGRVIFISGLVKFKVLDLAKEELRPVFLVFAPENISIHDTNEEKAKDLIGNRKVLYPPFDNNFNFDEIEFETKRYTISEGYDLSIPGLGWISVRRGPLVIEITNPKDITLHIRKSMVSPK